MPRRKHPNKEAFNKLLLWLDPDSEKAVQKYQTIQYRLVRIFSSRGCTDPEDLVDESFNVAALKIDWLLENYEGDPAFYLHGIAKKIFLEIKPTPVPPPRLNTDTDELERRSACLDECLERLTTPTERHLVLEYHAQEKQERIQTRRRLARELGCTINALRIKVFHIHARLRPCIKECLKLLEK
jgi:hypothetical protein